MEIRELNYPKRTVTYIGAQNGSGFVWIGMFGDVPERYMNLPVVETHKRTVDYKGMIVIADFGAKKCIGKYWHWNECDASIPPPPEHLVVTDDNLQNLLVAIMREAGREYRVLLKHAYEKLERPVQMDDVERMIAFARRSARNDIDILRGSQVGEYCIENIENEIRARAECPNWKDLSYTQRQKYLVKKTKEIRIRRAMEAGKKQYAKIKGRSVYHE